MIRLCVSVVLLLMILVPSVALSEGEVRTLVVDPRLLSPRSRGMLLASVAKAVPVQSWSTVQLEPGEVPYELLERAYGLSSARDFVLEAIEHKNGQQWSAVAAGDEILMPPLPSVPSESVAVTRSAQRLEVDAGELSSVNCLGDEQCVQGPPTSSAGVWEFVASAETFSRLLSALPGAVQDEILRLTFSGASPSAVSVLRFPEEQSSASPMVLGTATAASASAHVYTPDASFAGRLVLIDFFGSPCGHGKKVRDVVNQTLALLGAGDFGGHVIEKEAAYFPVTDDKRRLLEEYVDRVAPGLASPYIKAVLRGIEKSYKEDRNPRRVPLLYLQALIDEAARDPNTVAVSMSFFTIDDFFDPLPASFTSGSSAVLFSAVLNDNGRQIEGETFQPQRKFRDSLGNLGLVLVGSYTPEFEPYGSRSITGTRISCVAKGFGYLGSCIKASDIGNSFATPSVAATLLVAAASWKQQGTSLNAIDARRRLLLSVEPVPSLVPYYAAGGSPRLSILAAGSALHAVAADGTLLPIVVRSAEIRFRRRASSSSTTAPIERDGISGVAFVGSSAFIFEDASLRWKPILFEDLVLKAEDQGRQVEIRSSSFDQRGIRGVVFP